MHYNTRRYHKRMAKLREMLGGKCVVCGASSGLEMHHKDPKLKSFTISVEFDRPWEELTEELKKCELRCEEHHKVQHKWKHGLGGYSNHKCRCDVCRATWSARHKKYKADLAKRSTAPVL